MSSSASLKGDGPVAVLPIPLYLPNLPRESLAINFSDLYAVEGDSKQSKELLETLTRKRKAANDVLLPNPVVTEDPAKVVNEYVALLCGMIVESESQGDASPMMSPSGKTGAKDAGAKEVAVPLSRGVAFTWTNFTLQNNNISFGATEFEICSVVMNLGLWYLRAGKDLTLSRDSLRTDANQKTAFLYFCQAAGVFEHLHERAVDRDNGDLSDLKQGVYTALINIALAEAQAVTVVRNEQKHAPLIVSALCRDTAEKYSEAHRMIALANKETDKKLLAFLDFKSQYFLGKAYYYQALDLMNPDDPAVGRAIRSFDAAAHNIHTAIEIFGQFSLLSPKSKGHEALDFLEEVRSFYHAKLTKVQGQNDRLYNERVSIEIDPLPEPKSNTVPVKYEFPGVNTDLWTLDVYKCLRPKEDAIRAARRGKVSGIEQTSTCFSRAKSSKPKKTVAIAGGGIGGLTVAHELLERGYDVTIYEANDVFGGKAAAVGYNDHLIRDHSIKNFSAYYYCLLETMKRIPYDGPIYDDDDDGDDDDDDDEEEEEGKDKDKDKPEGDSSKGKGKGKAEDETEKKEGGEEKDKKDGGDKTQVEMAPKGKLDKKAAKEAKKAEKAAKKALQKKEKKAKAKAKAKEKRAKAAQKKKEARAKKGEDEEEKRTVFQNLRSYKNLKCVFPDGMVQEVNTKISTSLLSSLHEFQDLKMAVNKEGVPNRKVDKFLWKHLRLLFMCDERKRRDLDSISYEKYLGLDVAEHAEYKVLQNLIEITAAVKMDGSAWVGADQALKQFGKFFNPHKLKRQGNVLNGNIDDKFLYPWVKHIKKLGGKALVNRPLQKVVVDPKNPKKISGFLLSDGTEVTADHYVLALPFSKLKYVLNESLLVEQFSHSIPGLINFSGEKWGHNCHFALKALPQGAKPTVVHAAMGSPWAVIFYYVTKKLWKDPQHLSDEAPVQLWVTTSDATTPGLLHKKPYAQCTPQEFMEELLYQVQFREADKGLIVDTVVGHGLNWWDSEKQSTIVTVEPSSLCYWSEGSINSCKVATPGNSADSEGDRGDSGDHSFAPLASGSQSPLYPSGSGSSSEKKADSAPAAPAAEAFKLSEQVLVNGPPLHGQRVHKVSEGIQILCEAPLYAREVGMHEFPTTTPFKNLFLAGECVQTRQLCSTMEKANEAGKRCAHAVCAADGKSYPKTKFEYDPLPLHFLRAIDSAIFAVFS